MPSEIERLYREHRGRLVRLVERELRDHDDAEDVVQTAFLDAQRALEHGTIPRDPRAWLAAIALNAARRLRRRRLNAEPLEDYAVQEASGMSEIREALANLPGEQRAAVLYRDVLGFSYGETAEQMGTSVSAVTMLLHRGRRQLRQTLGAAVVGGAGLWRWLRQGGTPQVAAVKGAAAVVAATGLATGGIVAAGHTVRAVAPTRDETTAALVAHAGNLMAGAGQRTAGGVLRLDSARSHVETVDGSRAILAASAAPAVSQGSGGNAAPESVRASTAAVVASLLSPSTLPVPTVSLPTLPTSVPAATVTVSTPITTATVTTPTGTAATVTTPITTVTVPIP